MDGSLACAEADCPGFCEDEGWVELWGECYEISTTDTLTCEVGAVGQEIPETICELTELIFIQLTLVLNCSQ